MELYAERGYEQTTVAEIAQRAGLTARTFFRYFADKREVLFAGSEALGEQLDAALAAAPASATLSPPWPKRSAWSPTSSARTATSPAAARRSSPPTPSCRSGS